MSLNFSLTNFAKENSGWKANMFSRGSWLLIKLNLTSMSNHVLSYFKWPQKVNSTLNKSCKIFYWGNDMKHLPVVWNSACTPKDKGNLEIRPSDSFNQVALGKLDWKILLIHDKVSYAKKM